VSPVDRYTCEEVIRKLNDYLDRELSAEEMVLVREHLETCRQCAGAQAFEASVLEDLKRKVRRLDLPQSLIDKVRAILSDPQDDE
jgi:anti-sigma factor (TIGR02949 family)